MIELARAYIHWAEKAAYEDAIDAGFEVKEPDPNAPMTLDRLWEVCKKYLWGSSFLYKKSKSTGNTYNTNIFFYFADNSNSKKDDGVLTVLATILLIAWVLSGIAFQRVFKLAINKITDFGQMIATPFISFLGAIIGVIIAAVVGIFLKSIYNRPYSTYVQTGKEIGADIGSDAGEWIGWLTAIIPGAIIGTVLGIAAGLPMGALTLLIAPVQMIKTTYNAALRVLDYINMKFQEVLQRDNTQQPKVEQDINPKSIDTNSTMEKPNPIIEEKPSNIIHFASIERSRSGTTAEITGTSQTPYERLRRSFD